VINKCE
jgi:uncharacterized protein YjiS (DUF1127 family)